DFIALEEEDEGDDEPFTPNLEDTLRALSIVHKNNNSWAEYINRARRRALEALTVSRQHAPCANAPRTADTNTPTTRPSQHLPRRTQANAPHAPHANTPPPHAANVPPAPTLRPSHPHAPRLNETPLSPTRHPCPPSLDAPTPAPF
ncbi:hypothetical protein H0H92_014292, partial [Tricholoma furcatifolium]